MRKGTPVMDFNAYSNIILSLKEHDGIGKIKGEQKSQSSPKRVSLRI